MKRLYLILLTGMLYTSASPQCISDQIQGDPGNEILTENEIRSLQFLREEELLAGDVYEFLSGYYNLPVFRNIARSEDMHTSLVENVLNKYNAEDPSLNHKSGYFINPGLQELYNMLTDTGKNSLSSAVYAGLTIEEKDIFDLRNLLANTLQNEDARLVCQKLLEGSYRHIKAFNFHAERLELSFTPQFLNPEELKEILSTN